MNVARYIPPEDDPLHPYIHSIWSVRASGHYSRELILPKGNVDIVFNLADTFSFACSADSEDRTMTDGPHLAGLNTGVLTTHPDGEVNLIGLSLRMESAGAVLPLPVGEVTDRLVDGGEIFKGIADLYGRIHDARDFQERRALLTGWLSRLIDPDPRGDAIRRACGFVGADPTDARLDHVAADIGVSARHLRRLFIDHVGIGPAHYLKLSRFIKALGLMSTPASLTEIAMEAHYFDQAHFCRDFKSISGMTPREYRENVGEVPGHIFEEIENYEV